MPELSNRNLLISFTLFVIPVSVEFFIIFLFRVSILPRLCAGAVGGELNAFKFECTLCGGHPYKCCSLLGVLCNPRGK